MKRTCRLTIAAAAWLVGIGIPVPFVLRAQEAPPPVPSTGSPPAIFFYDSDGGDLVVRAVHRDGRPVPLDLPETGGLPASSPDGASFAYVTGDSLGMEVVLGDLGDGRRVLSRVEGQDPVLAGALDWSPDGRSLAAITFGAPPAGISVLVLDAAGGGEQSRHELPATAASFATDEPLTLRWSPDGKKILLASHEAYAIDVESGAVDSLAGHLVLPFWSPESDGVYTLDVTGSEADSSAVDEFLPRITGLAFRPLGGAATDRIAGKAVLDSLGLGDWQFVGVDVSPDGRRLVLWSARFEGEELASTIRLYDLSGGGRLDLRSPSRTFDMARTFVSSVRWGPAPGDLAVAIAGEDVQEIRIALLDPETGELTTLRRLAVDQALGMVYSHFIPWSVLSWGS